MDPGRDLDLERTLVEHTAGSFATGTRVLDDAARAAATRAGLAADELAEACPRDVLDAPRAVTLVAGRRSRAGLDPAAFALLARSCDLDGDLALDAGRGLF